MQPRSSDRIGPLDFDCAAALGAPILSDHIFGIALMNDSHVTRHEQITLMESPACEFSLSRLAAAILNNRRPNLVRSYTEGVMRITGFLSDSNLVDSQHARRLLAVEG